jgi:hypothetical protein
MASGAIGYYGQMLLYRLLPLVLDREVGRERLEHLSREMGKEGINQRLLLLAHPATLDRKAWKKLRDRLVELKVSPRPEECARRARAFTLDDSKHADQKEALEILHELLTAPARDFEAALERLEQDGHERPRGECLRQLWPVLCPDLPAKTEPGAVERVAEEVLGGSLLRPLSFWGWLRPGRGAAPVSKNHFTRARELADPAQLEALTVLEALVEERRQREIEYRLHALGRAWLLLHGPASVLLLLLLAGHVWVSVRLGGF